MSKRKRDDDPPLISPGFFVLRAPLLPIDELAAFSDGLEAPDATGAELDSAIRRDRRRARERLRSIVVRPEIREAIYVASRSLDESLDAWLAEPDGPRGEKVEGPLFRYVCRMTGRPTPFGLFAGSSLGRVGKETKLTLGDAGDHRRHLRLDGDEIGSLMVELDRHPAWRAVATYRPSTALYVAGGRIRYAEAQWSGGRRHYRLTAVEPTDYLEATIERARDGATIEQLARALISDEIDIEEATSFIHELLTSQILVSELATPIVTGPEPAHDLIRSLRRVPELASIAVELEGIQGELASIARAPLGIATARYRAVVERIAALRPDRPVQPGSPIQVDLYKPAADLALGENVIREIARAVSVLERMNAPSYGGLLADFARAFSLRYEAREVPLAEVLDEESGIGFSVGHSIHSEASPWLAGLSLRSGGAAEQSFGERHAFLLDALQTCAKTGAMELVLDDRALEVLSVPEPDPLPDSFAVIATLAAPSEEALAAGELTVYLRHGGGPSGGALLGRFCHGDPQLTEALAGYFKKEEALHPDVVFAELVHLPDGRLGNFVDRPLLRGYEITYLGRSGAPLDRQIPISDLTVSVSGSRVVLRSQRLGREVLPRLTSAHDYTTWNNLAVYRFLAALQAQGTAPVRFGWGPLQTASFLPRVRIGRAIVAPARWRLNRAELEKLEDSSGRKRHEEIRKIRAERSIPRHVLLAEADQMLPIDLEHALALDALIHLSKGQASVILAERWPAPEEVPLQGPGGRYLHELLVPLLRTHPRRKLYSRPGSKNVSPAERTHPPGSRWVYAKLYAGDGTLDLLLREWASPLIRRVAPAIERWFFLRYNDPASHLRLRILAKPGEQGAVAFAVAESAKPFIERGVSSRIAFDTYEREIERYGGVAGMAFAEAVFAADSEATLAIVESLSGDIAADLRFRFAWLGVHRMLVDLGLDGAARFAVVEEQRRGYGAEHRAGPAVERQLGQKWRDHRSDLEPLLDPAIAPPESLLDGIRALDRRSGDLAGLLAGFDRSALEVSFSEVAKSLVHMHANRLIRSELRAQELVLYDFLLRAYQSRAARERGPKIREK